MKHAPGAAATRCREAWVREPPLARCPLNTLRVSELRASPLRVAAHASHNAHNANTAQKVRVISLSPLAGRANGLGEE